MATINSFDVLGDDGHSVHCGDLLRITVRINLRSPGGVRVLIPDSSPCFFIVGGERTRELRRGVPHSGPDTVVFHPVIGGGPDALEVIAQALDNHSGDEASDRLRVAC